MINKLKIWFNRNDFKVFVIIIAFIFIYNGFKSFNKFYSDLKNEQSTPEEGSILNNDYDVEDYSENEIEVVNIERNTKEGEKVLKIINKIMNCVYEANTQEDNQQLKQDIYNMFSRKTIQKFKNEGEIVDVDSILNYTINIDDLKNYSIGYIYKVKELNGLARYIIMLKNSEDEINPIYSYVMLDVDNNNNTFEYCGGVNSIKSILEFEIEEIENRTSNTI